MKRDKLAGTPFIEKAVDAVVVGAGVGGLYMVHRLREAGLSVQGIEVGDDVGGTWYWNRYPGARCDVPSLSYSYTWCEDVRKSWRWTEKYAGQPEILRYINYVTDRYDLRSHFKFGTRVSRATYDEASGLWCVETDRGDRFSARYCIMATGCLSVPNEPWFKGIESFRGEVYHTGRWPHREVDFNRKRVAIIGTGSSGIQAAPVIAERADALYVFQRTANFSLPAFNRPLKPDDIEAFEANYPAYKEMLRQGNAGAMSAMPKRNPTEEEWQAMKDAVWSGGGLFSLYTFPNFMIDADVNEAAAEFARSKICETVKDPKTADKLSPHGYPMGAKRLCLDSNYYEMFNRDTVSLVDLHEEPIAEIATEGVRTAVKLYGVDMIVFATGFDAMTGALLKIDIRGRQGVKLKSEWESGPRSYLGLMIAGFPNLFTITGPGSPSVLSNVITSCEQHADWIAKCIAHMRARSLTTIEAERNAQEAWVAHVNELADRTLYTRAKSWYLGANIPGKPRVFMPFVGEGYKKRCDEIAERNYEGFAFSP